MDFGGWGLTTEGWTWLTCCYLVPLEEAMPYGFCRPCWEKHGSPVPVSVKDRPINDEP